MRTLKKKRRLKKNGCIASLKKVQSRAKRKCRYKGGCRASRGRGAQKKPKEDLSRDGDETCAGGAGLDFAGRSTDKGGGKRKKPTGGDNLRKIAADTIGTCTCKG